MRFPAVTKLLRKGQNRKWSFIVVSAVTLIAMAASSAAGAKSISSEIMRYDAAAEAAQRQIDTVKEVSAFCSCRNTED